MTEEASLNQRLIALITDADVICGSFYMTKIKITSDPNLLSITP
jgi:hypothetical protein